MVIETSSVAHFRDQAMKARYFAERLGGKDALVLQRYAAECESKLHRLLGEAPRGAAN
jgi:hypothetical protein